MAGSAQQLLAIILCFLSQTVVTIYPQKTIEKWVPQGISMVRPSYAG